MQDGTLLPTVRPSVSLRGASTIATDTAQIILIDQSLSLLETLFELSQKFEENMQVTPS